MQSCWGEEVHNRRLRESTSSGGQRQRWVKRERKCGVMGQGGGGCALVDEWRDPRVGAEPRATREVGCGWRQQVMLPLSCRQPFPSGRLAFRDLRRQLLGRLPLHARQARLGGEPGEEDGADALCGDGWKTGAAAGQRVTPEPPAGHHSANARATQPPKAAPPLPPCLPLLLTLPDDGQNDAGGRVEQQHAGPHAAQRGPRPEQAARGEMGARRGRGRVHRRSSSSQQQVSSSSRHRRAQGAAHRPTP